MHPIPKTEDNSNCRMSISLLCSQSEGPHAHTAHLHSTLKLHTHSTPTPHDHTASSDGPRAHIAHSLGTLTTHGGTHTWQPPRRCADRLRLQPLYTDEFEV